MTEFFAKYGLTKVIESVTNSTNKPLPFNLNDPDSLDVSSIILSTVGTVLTLALTYYSLRTINLFKRSAAARAWVYISLSAIFFSTGLVMFLVEALATPGLFVWAGVSMTIGGFFLFLGLRKNFLFWASQDHFS